MLLKNIKIQQIIDLFKKLQPYCIAIYLGGSYILPFIKNPHDYDYICFANNSIDMCKIKRLLTQYCSDKTIWDDTDDFIQIRDKNLEEHAYGSYINKDMVLLCGEKINFTFDPAIKDRIEYINILYNSLSTVHNKKRYYQLYRGYLIAKKQSYELTEQEIEDINILHDQKEEDKEKIVLLIEQVKNNIIELWWSIQNEKETE